MLVWNSLKDISPRGWRMLARWTVFGTLGCTAVAVLMNLMLFGALGGTALSRAMVSGVLIPILLAGPLFFYLTLKLRELAIANHKLAELASTDSLTACLNRRAFASHIDAWLADPTAAAAWRSAGALLVIDADHFKKINDRFGHDQGDEALKLIAGSIRSVLRAGDLAGRLGGEEFAVFLPGATPENAAEVAERIRAVIEKARFEPNGCRCRLSVSVGVASFEEQSPSFSELFRLADERLYEAKNAGRNRIRLAHIADPCEPLPALAALH
jgi:diguanylate cyclase (GGDEF)-like protein